MNALLELFCEFDLVEEDPRIVVLVVEPILEFPYALHSSIHLLVPAEHYEGCACLSDLRIKRSDVNYDCFTFFVSTGAVEQTRYGGSLAVRFVGDAED